MMNYRNGIRFKQILYNKDGIEKTINAVFKKSKVAVSPKTITVGYGATQQFTVA